MWRRRLWKIDLDGVLSAVFRVPVSYAYPVRNTEHAALLRPSPSCLLLQIQISRQLPAGRGPRGSVVLGVVTLTMMVGYYKLGQANKARRAEKHEKRLVRMALMPMLQVREKATCEEPIRDREVEQEHTSGVSYVSLSHFLLTCAPEARTVLMKFQCPLLVCCLSQGGVVVSEKDTSTPTILQRAPWDCFSYDIRVGGACKHEKYRNRGFQAQMCCFGKTF